MLSSTSNARPHPEDAERRGPLGPEDVACGADEVTEHAGDGRTVGHAGDELGVLVDAAREGDEQAFGALVDATYLSTYTLALHITGDREDARDVTQEAYLRAYRSLGSFRGDAQFTTWMYRITANCASTSLRRRRRHRHEELPDASEVVDVRHEGDPQLRADASDLRDRLLEALDTLPPKLRAVVVLRDVYELSHDAIATELGITATAAKVRLHRARHRLRAELFPGAAAGAEDSSASDGATSSDGEAAASRGGTSRGGTKGARSRAV